MTAVQTLPRSVGPMVDPLDEQFGSATSGAILRTACASVGLSSTGARLLRVGENALYRLAGVPVVVRIGRSADHWCDAVKEVNVASWLADVGFSAARTHEIDQPVGVGGHPVTFWRFISGRRGGPQDVAVLGTLLRLLHKLDRPVRFELAPEDVFGRVRPRIEKASVPSSDREFLVGRLEQLRQEVGRLTFPLPPSPTHGDAHVQNLMMGDSGATLIDFERFSWGQPEWDLSMTATEYVTAGWWTQREYKAFADTYGFDVMEWSGFETLRAVHEIKMTTWLMQNINESVEVAEEYRTRMATMSGVSRGVKWKAF